MRFKYYPLALLVVAACAHEQPKVESPAPAVVQAPPPAAPPPAPTPARDDSGDLQRLLSEPLAHFAFDWADFDAGSPAEAAGGRKRSPGSAWHAHPAQPGRLGREPAGRRAGPRQRQRRSMRFPPEVTTAVVRPRPRLRLVRPIRGPALTDPRVWLRGFAGEHRPGRGRGLRLVRPRVPLTDSEAGRGRPGDDVLDLS